MIDYLANSLHIRKIKMAMPTATNHRLRSNQDFFGSLFSSNVYIGELF